MEVSQPSSIIEIDHSCRPLPRVACVLHANLKPYYLKVKGGPETAAFVFLDGPAIPMEAIHCLLRNHKVLREPYAEKL